jgi:hypothetical protein
MDANILEDDTEDTEVSAEQQNKTDTTLIKWQDWQRNPHTKQLVGYVQEATDQATSNAVIASKNGNAHAACLALAKVELLGILLTELTREEPHSHV